jgi:hypothetical protein
MRKIILVLSVLLLCCGPSNSEVRPEEKAIRDSFQTYIKGLIDKDGETVWTVIDAQSVEFYEDMLKKAATLSYAQMEAADLDLTRMFFILRMRNDFKKYLKKMSPKQVFVAAVEKGYIGSKESLQSISIDTIEIRDDAAFGYLPSAPKETALQFAKEDGKWKVSLFKMMQYSHVMVNYLFEKSGKTEKEFLMDLLSGVSMGKVTQDVFDAP